MGGMMDPKLRSELRPVGASGVYQEVRLFADPAVQGAIDTALKSVAADKRGVILEVDMPEAGGLQGVVAARLNNHWSIGLTGAYTGNKKITGGARVAFEW